jgi:CheY-like chemotaxis protein/anti-sigma regulatory factor (Ser/Thr protein kinase)
MLGGDRMTHSDLLVVDDDDPTRTGLRHLLVNAGFTVDVARDGAEALNKIVNQDFGVVLDALRGQAYDFLPKPIEPARLIEIVKRALSTKASVSNIDVLSARPEWVELLVPCTREAAERIQSFLQQLETDLPTETRESVGLAFRELLLNGVEWGGQLNPEQKVRAACLRTRRILPYRIADPGPGFTFDELSHAAVDNSLGVVAHDDVRHEKGLRPGGFGLMLIRAIADELIYNEQQNEVVFIKYLD